MNEPELFSLNSHYQMSGANTYTVKALNEVGLP